MDLNENRKGITDNSFGRTVSYVCVVASILALITTILLIQDYHLGHFIDPLQPHILKQFSDSLQVKPADESAKNELRQMDRHLRTLYYRHLRFRNDGFKLLLVFISVAVAAGVYRWHYRLPARENLAPKVNAASTFWSMRLTTVLAVAIGSGIVCLLLWSMYPKSAQREAVFARVDTSAAMMTLSAAAIPFTSDRMRREWPQFRGYDGNGVTVATNYPLHWNSTSAVNIAWCVPIHLLGNSSPIVWQDRVYLTAADAGTCAIYCYAVADGTLIWSNLWQSAQGPGDGTKIMDDTGYAAPTPATDGRMVCAIFANGDMVGIGMDGRRKWLIHLGPLESMYGYASSLAMLPDGLLIVQIDQGFSAEDRRSRLLYVDSETGITKFTIPRSVPNSWSSPIVVRDGPTNMIITAANPYVIAYDAVIGAELWRADCLSGDVAPSPVYHCGMVYAVNAGAALSAIRLGGTGNVTQTHLQWKADDNLPDICSPLVLDGRIYLLTTFGILTCYNATDGSKMWHCELNKTFRASPAAVGRRLLLTADDGVTIVAECGTKFTELWRSQIGDVVNASLAFADGSILIRGNKFLWCIREKHP